MSTLGRSILLVVCHLAMFVCPSWTQVLAPGSGPVVTSSLYQINLNNIANNPNPNNQNRLVPKLTATPAALRPYLPQGFKFGTLQSKRKSFVQILRKRNPLRSMIDNVLQAIGLQPKLGVRQFISFQTISRIDLLQIGPCYNNHVGTQVIDIFRASLKEIIHVFITEYQIKFKIVHIFNLIQNLIESLKEIVMLVVDCISSPPELRSQYGLTYMSALSSKEFNQTLNHYLMDKDDENKEQEEEEEDRPRNIDEEQSEKYGKWPTNSTEVNQFDLIDELEPEPESGDTDDQHGHNRARRSTSKFFQYSRHTKTDNRHCSFRMHDDDLPKRFDWRDHHVVTPVKNQGHCGGCYIFSAVASLESAILIKIRSSSRGRKEKSPEKRLNLSEQQILNCMHSKKCIGGHTYQVFQYMNKHGAIKQKYEVFRGKEHHCKAHRNAKRYRIRSYCYFRHGLTDRQLQILVYKYGPSMVAIDSHGIKHLKGKYNGNRCKRKLNHAVTLVGWTKRYWIIKNSWTKHWGVGGYLYLRRDTKQGRRCGINSELGVVIL